MSMMQVSRMHVSRMHVFIKHVSMMHAFMMHMGCMWEYFPVLYAPAAIENGITFSMGALRAAAGVGRVVRNGL